MALSAFLLGTEIKGYCGGAVRSTILEIFPERKKKANAGRHLTLWISRHAQAYIPRESHYLSQDGNFKWIQIPVFLLDLSLYFLPRVFCPSFLLLLKRIDGGGGWRDLGLMSPSGIRDFVASVGWGRGSQIKGDERLHRNLWYKLGYSKEWPRLDIKRQKST